MANLTGVTPRVNPAPINYVPGQRLECVLGKVSVADILAAINHINDQLADIENRLTLIEVGDVIDTRLSGTTLYATDNGTVA